MSRSQSIPLVPGLLALLCLSAMTAATAAEEKSKDDLTIAQLPAPVAATLRAQAGKAEIEEIEARKEADVQVYEAEIELPTGTVTVVIAADGTLLRTETKLALTAMPAAVQAAAKRAFGASTPKHGEQETAGAQTSYALEGEIGADEVEIHFAADGTERSREVQKDDDHDDNHDDSKAGSAHGPHGQH